MSGLIGPTEAEAVVRDRIETFGPGALPPVEVVEATPGVWHVRWAHSARLVRAMSLEAWCAWVEENVGSLDAADLETTES